MNISNQEYDTLFKKLEDYAELDGTEVGEYCRCLLNMRSYVCNSYTNEFPTAYINEIKALVSHLEMYCEIVEETVTYTYTERRLEDK